MNNSVGEQLRHVFSPLEAMSRRIVPAALASVAMMGAFAGSAQAEKIPTAPMAEVHVTPSHNDELFKDISALPDETTVSEKRMHNFSDVILQGYASSFEASKISESEKKQLNKVASRLNNVVDNNSSKKIMVSITGMASDESLADSVRGDNNLGKPSGNNEQVALERAETRRQYLQAKLDDPQKITITVDAKEAILSKSTIAKLDLIADDHGISRQQLISNYNSGHDGKLSQNEQRQLDQAFAKQRGVRISASSIEKQYTFSESIQKTEAHKPVAAKEEANSVPASIKYLPLLLIIPPLLALRRRRQNKEVKAPAQPYAYQPFPKRSLRRSISEEISRTIPKEILHPDFGLNLSEKAFLYQIKKSVSEFRLKDVKRNFDQFIDRNDAELPRTPVQRLFGVSTPNQHRLFVRAVRKLRKLKRG